MMLHIKYQGYRQAVSDNNIFISFPYKFPFPRVGPFLAQSHHLNKLGKGYTSNIKAQGIVVSDKKIFFKVFIPKIIPPIYAMDWNHLNSIYSCPMKTHHLQ